MSSRALDHCLIMIPLSTHNNSTSSRALDHCLPTMKLMFEGHAGCIVQNLAYPAETVYIKKTRI